MQAANYLIQQASSMPNFRDGEARDDVKSEEGGEKSDDICRDFLRNNCSRGNRCRYRHPSDVDNGGGNSKNGRKSGGGGGDLEFCHDFQNAGCRRVNCRFVHCSRDEEEQYRRTGQLPQQGPGGPSRGRGDDFDDLPICKDFLNGECRRSGRCKYRHVTQRELDMEDMQRERMMMSDRGRFNDRSFSGGPPRMGFDDDFDMVGAKRRCLDGPQFGGRMMSPEEVQMLQDENSMLRQKVEQLRKQVSDLTATNETLLEQNARYRSGQVGGMRAPSGTGLPQPGGMSSSVSGMGGYGEPMSRSQPLLGSSAVGSGAYGAQRNPSMGGAAHPGLVSYPRLG